eukprot:Clim_evm9s153 gene=Clim_evmTU9s153
MTQIDRNSIADFQQAAYRTAEQVMDVEITNLALQITDEAERREKSAQLNGFLDLFNRFIELGDFKIDWEKVKSPAEGMVEHYDTLNEVDKSKLKSYLNRLVVLKLNGGLGTTMGCKGPKSVIEVKNDQTFLDLAIQQIEKLNEVFDVDVPLVLMNSFNTHEDTTKILQQYEGRRITIKTFNQSRFPRILRESLTPAPQNWNNSQEWYPPGHGDVYASLQRSGLLEELVEQGKDWLFMSNIDNLGATVDTKILQYVVESGLEYLMEVTDKTMADVKGGTLVEYEGKVKLLEIAQVPKEHVADFKSIKKFKIFNTNNVWFHLPALKRELADDELALDVIINNKTLDDGTNIIQLETACGAAIQYFHKAKGMNVPRSRFLPVKSCSDLLLIKSDLYDMTDGCLTMTSKRPLPQVPLVKLGAQYFKKVNDFLNRFESMPKIIELDHLTVTGNVSFGNDVTLKGTVIIVASHGERIDIPPGSVFENQVISGTLRMTNH